MFPPLPEVKRGVIAYSRGDPKKQTRMKIKKTLKSDLFSDEKTIGHVPFFLNAQRKTGRYFFLQTKVFVFTQKKAVVLFCVKIPEGSKKRSCKYFLYYFICSVFLYYFTY